MSLTVAITSVTTLDGGTAEVSLQRLKQASGHSQAVLSGGALLALITLTAMAHPADRDGDIVGGSFFTSELDQLEKLKYIRRVGRDAIELI